MTDPQQPTEWSDPDWQQPTQASSVPPALPASDPTPYTPYAQPGYASPPMYGQPAYGQPAYGQPGYGQPIFVNRPTNGMAIAALVCSLAGLAVFISAPVGAILGHVARKQIRESGEQGDGMALAGIIVGWILTGFMLCACAVYAGLLATLFGLGGGASTQ
jgi:hypothetical protein